MSRAILKTGNTILRTSGKIFQVGEVRPPILDLNPAGMGLAHDTPVSLFTDVSGNNLHGQQLDVARQPLFKTNQINGFPAIEFDGSNDYMQLPASLFAQTIFVITRAMIANHSTIGQPYGAIFSNPSNVNAYLGGSNNTYFDHENTGFGSSPNNKLYVNGVVLSSTNQGTRNLFFTLMTLDVTDITSFSRLVGLLGARSVTQDFYKGQIARLIVYNYRLPALERAAIEQELMSEYAL